MVEPREIWYELQRFMDSGGEVLYIIMFVIFLIMTMILERYWYFWSEFKKDKQAMLDAWSARKDHSSWHAHKIRDKLISQISGNMSASMTALATLVAICPLLGLLGTVTGMVSVFEVMAQQGTSNARLMAGGVSRATIPTMAGMIGAIVGLFFASRLQRRVKAESHHVSDMLTLR
jgi:biopolymer transport protein ExbB